MCHYRFPDGRPTVVGGCSAPGANEDTVEQWRDGRFESIDNCRDTVARSCASFCTTSVCGRITVDYCRYIDWLKNGRSFVIGGFDGLECLREVTVFDKNGSRTELVRVHYIYLSACFAILDSFWKKCSIMDKRRNRRIEIKNSNCFRLHSQVVSRMGQDVSWEEEWKKMTSSSSLEDGMNRGQWGLYMRQFIICCYDLITTITTINAGKNDYYSNNPETSNSLAIVLFEFVYYMRNGSISSTKCESRAIQSDHYCWIIS